MFHIFHLFVVSGVRVFSQNPVLHREVGILNLCNRVKLLKKNSRNLLIALRSVYKHFPCVSKLTVILQRSTGNPWGCPYSIHPFTGQIHFPRPNNQQCQSTNSINKLSTMTVSLKDSTLTCNIINYTEKHNML